VSGGDALRLDADDPLAGFRARFHVPAHGDGECVYLCGNSLGLQPRAAGRYLDEELEAWRRFGVEGHFRGRRPWKDYHEQFAAPLAMLAGAREHEVVCMNGLTVNLHLLMVSFFRPTRSRYKLLIERSAFPSDRYAVLSQLQFHGLDPDDALIEVGRRAGETALRDEDIAAAIRDAGEALALVLLPGVQYLSGEALDIAQLTREAHAVGALAGWDLAHAIGNLPLELHEAGADFAAWCSYKYLNGGPGAVAGAFIHERHSRDPDLPRFAGWWGHDKTARFRMAPDFTPMPGAEGWQISNPPVLGMAALLASLEIFMDAGIAPLRAKSLALTGLLARRLEEALAGEVEILTPLSPARRGCQLSLRLRDGAETGRVVHERLGTAGMVCDWREPDVIRVAPVPLYNRYQDIERFVSALEKALH
jgi:kynureninase